MKNRIYLEIIYEGDQCPASYYMAKAVEDVLTLYGDRIDFVKLDFKKNREHSMRFCELSVSLFGEDAVRRMQLAPVPSIFINGDLVFDRIPIRDDLVAAIEDFLGKCDG